jgi:hypothetical protein
MVEPQGQSEMSQNPGGIEECPVNLAEAQTPIKRHYPLAMVVV